MSDSEPRLAVGYAMVSIKEENIENQVLEIERFAKSMGYILIEVFKDIGISDSVPTFQREGFRNMLTWLETTPKVVRTIIVYDLTRLGRNAKDIMEVYDHLTSRGYNILFVKTAQLQQQEQAKAEEKPAEQQTTQKQAELPASPTTEVLPRGDFKSTQIGYVSFRELVLGLPAYAPTGGIKLIIQKSKYFSSPGKTEDAWSAVVFTYSEMPYGNTMVIVPEPHVITCRNLATCIREGLLALYRYSRKEILERIARTGIIPARLYADTLLIPVCADKMCMKTDILVLDPDWPGGFIHIRSSGVDVQLRAVPANKYELFIQAGEKPIFRKYTLAVTPHGTYVVT
jgi:hypothetical protein